MSGVGGDHEEFAGTGWTGRQPSAQEPVDPETAAAESDPEESDLRRFGWKPGDIQIISRPTHKSGFDPHSAMTASDPLAGALDELAEHVQTVTVPSLGSLAEVRERHLSAAVKAVLGRRSGKVASSTVVPVAEWPLLRRSPVDVVIPEGDDPRLPRHVLELKWCQRAHDKVYEAIWDLFKVALLTRLETVETGHLVTGGPVELWETAFCRDIFEGGRFEPEELCGRVLPRGRDPWIAWDDLLYGGYDRFPDRVPDSIETRPLRRLQVTDGSRTWEIRAVSVHPSRDDVPFVDGWPRGERPPRTHRPLAPASVETSPAAARIESSEQSAADAALTEGFDEAITLARTWHARQFRKGTTIPYLSHLLAVTALVLEDGGDETEAIAALLHDAVEDQGGPETLETIRACFGDRVAEIVDACSDTDEVPKPPWRQRKDAYIEHLALAEPPVLRVSLADKLHNARAILFDLRVHGDRLWSRFSTNSAEDQLWYYDVLARTFERRLPGPMAAELRRAVDEIAVLSRADDQASSSSADADRV